MSGDLIALVIGVALAGVVVCLGWRRNLAEVTQSWLPQFGKAPKSNGSDTGVIRWGRGHRKLSPRQRQFAIWAYLAISVFNATFAVLSADGRLLHVINVALFAAGAVVFVLRKPFSPAI